MPQPPMPDRPNLVTGPVQICWHKFARYWDVELREVPMAEDRLLMTPEEAIARIDENTIGVVPTLGVTFTGAYEPVKAIGTCRASRTDALGLAYPCLVLSDVQGRQPASGTLIRMGGHPGL